MENLVFILKFENDFSEYWWFFFETLTWLLDCKLMKLTLAVVALSLSGFFSIRSLIIGFLTSLSWKTSITKFWLASYIITTRPSTNTIFGQCVIVLCATSEFGFCFFLDNGLSHSFNRKKRQPKKINPKTNSQSASSTIHRFERVQRTNVNTVHGEMRSNSKKTLNEFKCQWENDWMFWQKKTSSVIYTRNWTHLFNRLPLLKCSLSLTHTYTRGSGSLFFPTITQFDGNFRSHAKFNACVFVTIEFSGRYLLLILIFSNEFNRLSK